MTLSKIARGPQGKVMLGGASEERRFALKSISRERNRREKWGRERSELVRFNEGGSIYNLGLTSPLVPTDKGGGGLTLASGSVTLVTLLMVRFKILNFVPFFS